MPSPMDLLRAILSLNKLVEISCKALYTYIFGYSGEYKSFYLLYLVSYNNLFLYSRLSFSIFCFDILIVAVYRISLKYVMVIVLG